VRAKDAFGIFKGAGNNPSELLRLSEDESILGGSSAYLSDNFHVSKQTVNGNQRFILGFGLKANGNQLNQIVGGQSGAAIQSSNGTISFFSGISNASNPIPKMTITNMGRIGIGTTNPSSILEVNGGDLEVENGALKVKNGDMTLTCGELVIKNGRFVLANQQGVKHFEVKDNGFIVAREILVDIDEAIPDYVFDEDYELMDLKALRTYLSEERHLPNIPSADEYATKGGIELGDLSLRLLEKQEELVLYILQLEDRILKLEKDNAR
jgi:hypothetical protein